MLTGNGGGGEIREVEKQRIRGKKEVARKR